jgi:hypothetical protein
MKRVQVMINGLRYVYYISTNLYLLIIKRARILGPNKRSQRQIRVKRTSLLSTISLGTQLGSLVKPTVIKIAMVAISLHLRTLKIRSPPLSHIALNITTPLLRALPLRIPLMEMVKTKRVLGVGIVW